MYKSLIIDDEKPVQIAISKLGRWHKYNIKMPELANNGAQGLKVMREIHPSYCFCRYEYAYYGWVQFP